MMRYDVFVKELCLLILKNTIFTSKELYKYLLRVRQRVMFMSPNLDSDRINQLYSSIFKLYTLGGVDLFWLEFNYRYKNIKNNIDLNLYIICQLIRLKYTFNKEEEKKMNQHVTDLIIQFNEIDVLYSTNTKYNIKSMMNYIKSHFAFEFNIEVTSDTSRDEEIARQLEYQLLFD